MPSKILFLFISTAEAVVLAGKATTTACQNKRGRAPWTWTTTTNPTPRQKVSRLSHQQLQQFDSHHENNNGCGVHALYQGCKPHNMSRLVNGQLVFIVMHTIWQPRTLLPHPHPHHDVGHHSNGMIPPPSETTPPAKVNRGYPQGGKVGHDPDERRDDEPVASNFADFDGHAFIAQSEDSDNIESVANLVLQKRNVVDKSPSRNAAAQSNKASSSKSASNPKSPLAALLSHKNDKKNNGNTTTTNTANREKVSSASVNSEPVITSSYLRQYHKNRSLYQGYCVGNIDHTSSEAPTTHSDHMWSSDKEGGGKVGVHGTSRRVRVSEVVLVVGIGGE
eukprot:scaffold130113_cov47-Attheya_sp.AAC.1